ncbi:MAG: Re/Si-specific NAD(P)(+) transhydrogenase subunit alpha [Alphaproteobacteria bacterium]|nr:Re/Si-specific NAD(P)(+) transhydrogenase subunit alpha [Alphaproteobacteria bacterium]
MRVAIPRETFAGERRVAATPDTVGRLKKLGLQVRVQTGAGAEAGFSDDAFADAGAELVDSTTALYDGADIVAKIRAPSDAEIAELPKGVVLIALLWPLQNPDLVEKLAAAGLTAISLDRIPRISRAQKMDVLSSMANIAGYRAVVEAANLLPRFMGGQITAAGKTPPARVLVIGAGVAGLAAIGAARGMGAEVFAFDTRAAVREQVQSMGAKFLEVQIEESGEGAGGYAKVMSKEFIDAEMALFREHAPRTDIVITTALIPGKPAPKLWLADMVERMQPGSVVVDLAAAQGGNCEGTVPDEVAKHHGVSIVGYTDLTSRLPAHASQFFARNIVHLLSDMGGGELKVDLDDEVVRAATCVHAGEVLPPPPPPEPSPPPPKQEERAHVAGPKKAEVALPENVRWAFAGLGAVLALSIGMYAPDDFVQHFTVFILACFVGWQVVWNVTPALHTPLMSVTNAISGIIVIGGFIQAGANRDQTATWLAAVAILFASINIAGGFLVTERMLAMFRKGA